MLGPSDEDQAFSRLRRLAAEDPREARKEFCNLLDTKSPLVNAVLRRVASPGEGRLRQLIANAVRTRHDRQDYFDHFRSWLSVETDEFARRALEASLEGMESVTSKQTQRDSPVDPRLVEIYRYVTGRLRHQLRNALMEPRASLLRLRRQIRDIKDRSDQFALDAVEREISEQLDRFNLILGFDSGDSNFQFRYISLADWLERFTSDFNRKFGSIRLSIEDNLEGRKIYASDYLLQIIFTNIWINAQQSVDAECEIRVSCRFTSAEVQIHISDNGPGFPMDIVPLAFVERQPRSPQHQGLGLLEIQEATERLHGRCMLAPDNEGNYRLVLVFPVK